MKYFATLENEAISKVTELEISREIFMEICGEIPVSVNGSWITEVFGIKMRILSCRAEVQR